MNDWAFLSALKNTFIFPSKDHLVSISVINVWSRGYLCIFVTLSNQIRGHVELLNGHDPKKWVLNSSQLCRHISSLEANHPSHFPQSLITPLITKKMFFEKDVFC